MDSVTQVRARVGVSRERKRGRERERERGREGGVRKRVPPLSVRQEPKKGKKALGEFAPDPLQYMILHGRGKKRWDVERRINTSSIDWWLQHHTVGSAASSFPGGGGGRDRLSLQYGRRKRATRAQRCEARIEDLSRRAVPARLSVSHARRRVASRRAKMLGGMVKLTVMM